MKTCFITGANAGIGKAAAIQLAQEGFYTIIGCRNLERGEVAVNEIKARSKSDFVELVQIDLSSTQSILKAVATIKTNHQKLDVLINNAAAFDISQRKPEKSADGIETIWATNHIGPVRLTFELLDLLQNSTQGRIITIASKGLLMYPNLKVNLNDPEFKHRKFSVSKAYYQSKLAQIMFTYWIANDQKDNNITANCIRVTNVKVDLSRYPNISEFMKWVYKLKSKSSIEADEMAKTYTLLAASDEFSDVTGKYFNEKNEIVDSFAYSYKNENIEAVMNLTKNYLRK